MEKTPTRVEVLAALGAADALPMRTELDFYTQDPEPYDRALRVIESYGWEPTNVERQTLTNGVPWEQFELAGLVFVSPKGYVPLTTKTPAEVLAAIDLSGPITFRVDGCEIEVDGPISDALRKTLADFAGRPLPSREKWNDANVVALRRRGRGRQVAPQQGGA